MPRLKICGITRLEDALLAVEHRADYVGLIFTPASRRCLEPAKARAIADAVRDRVALVGVFMDQERAFIESVVRTVGLDLIQLHGEEDRSLIAKLPVPVIKTTFYGPGSGEPRDTETAAYTLLDRPRDASPSCRRDPDPDALASALANLAGERKCFIAGGINPDNLPLILNRFDSNLPFAIDVSSGVESETGIKCPFKIERLNIMLDKNRNRASEVSHAS
ncbi:MAG: phosphoribosylanthranilate isomerase [Cyanobacteria bacterium HKST-UBA02]|nr:phosphoribosylanthranilate isomerase [Cyanobacteria bacterium HKST-UBA02]